MEQALKGIRRLRERSTQVAVTGNRDYNPGWHTALDLHNLLTVSEAVTRAGLLRKESRGGHYREDFPKKDDAAGKVSTVVRKGADGAMEIEVVPIPEMPPELAQI